MTLIHLHIINLITCAYLHTINLIIQQRMTLIHLHIIGLLTYDHNTFTYPLECVSLINGIQLK